MCNCGCRPVTLENIAAVLPNARPEEIRLRQSIGRCFVSAF